MTQDRPADAFQSEHERKVAEHEKARGETYVTEDATVDPGRRPTSGEDLAADQTDDGDEAPESGHRPL